MPCRRKVVSVSPFCPSLAELTPGHSKVLGLAQQVSVMVMAVLRQCSTE